MINAVSIISDKKIEVPEDKASAKNISSESIVHFPKPSKLKND